jgi:hypothetical protein
MAPSIRVCAGSQSPEEIVAVAAARPTASASRFVTREGRG